MADESMLEQMARAIDPAAWGGAIATEEDRRIYQEAAFQRAGEVAEAMKVLTEGVAQALDAFAEKAEQDNHQGLMDKRWWRDAWNAGLDAILEGK